MRNQFGTKMNDLESLASVWRSYQGHVNHCALHSTLNISETVTDRVLVPKGPPIGRCLPDSPKIGLGVRVSANRDLANRD